MAFLCGAPEPRGSSGFYGRNSEKLRERGSAGCLIGESENGKICKALRPENRHLNRGEENGGGT